VAPAVNAIRLLALTGCSRSEVLNLRWCVIGEGAINLRNSKTGPRAVPHGAAARAHIEALPGGRDPDAFLFPQNAEWWAPQSLIKRWRAVCADSKLGRLCLHDLRHTAASLAVMSGEGLPQVGKMLGHLHHRTTAGYVHLADSRLVKSGGEGQNLHRRGDKPRPGVAATPRPRRGSDLGVEPLIGPGTVTVPTSSQWQRAAKYLFYQLPMT